jgi:hypothetical protein
MLLICPDLRRFDGLGPINGLSTFNAAGVPICRSPGEPKTTDYLEILP